MGNYKFRFSDMMPNAWFHKLKDMNKPRSIYSKTLNHAKKKHHSSSSPPPLPPSPSAAASQSHHTSDPEFTKQQQPHLSDQRKSYYFTRDLTFQPDSDKKNLVAEPPQKSSRRRRRWSTKKRNPPPRLVSSSAAAAACKCRTTIDDSPPSPEESTNSGPDQSSSSEPDSVLTEYGSDRDRNRDDFNPPGSWSSTPCKCRAGDDIVIDDSGDHRRLPPIITKKSEPPTTKIRQRTSAEFSERNAYGSLSVKVVKDDFLTKTVRKFPTKSSAATTSPGVKLRVNSPRMRIQGRRSVSSSSSSASRRSISDSFAVVKASKDPGRDFKESMVEMIVENNMRASKDLEDLLACYLSLNSDEYHDLIINVFKQIWFDFIHLRLK